MQKIEPSILRTGAKPPSTTDTTPHHQAVALIPDTTKDHPVPMAGVGSALKFSFNPQVSNPIEFDFSMDGPDKIYFTVSDMAGHPFTISGGDYVT